MKPKTLRPGVQWMGSIDWDRRLFDSLIPLPDGTSYNAYLVKGSEKTALIDTTDPEMVHVLMSQLKDVYQLDYVIAQHAEQDHSGALPLVLAKYPEAQVYTSPKAKGMLLDLLQLPEERLHTVEDGETLSLGDRTLEFLHTPWVHWPETMSTYLREERILFPCDFFGSHLATSELFSTHDVVVQEAAKRYYAEIMMPFRKIIAKHLERLDKLPIDMIAPSHGPVHDEPAHIMGAYRDWVTAPPRNEAVVAYTSMHGSTGKMAAYLVAALAERGVRVRQFNLMETDIGKLAMSLVDAATLVFGTPTVLAGPHPNVLYAANLANALRPKLMNTAVFGSYGWSSKAAEQVTAALPHLKLEVLDPVMVRGAAREDDLRALDRLASAIAEKHAAADLH